jgi:glycosyltransferase involved in cell wall biosynthesis
MRFGLPLAVANTPVFNEVYDNAAMYFDAQNPDDIAEQLRLLAVDRQYYEHKQELAIARSRFFDWHKTAQRTLDILKAASGKPEAIQAPVAFAIEN